MKVIVMRPNPCQKTFFEERAEKWDTIVTHSNEKIRHILNTLNVQAGQTILDVGTGTGVLIPFLTDLIRDEGQIVAVDFAENMVKVARCKFPPNTYPNVTFLPCDINEYSPPSDFKFDHIICFSCFPHFINQDQTIAHFTQLLKTGGQLLIAHENSRDFINSIHQNTGKEVKSDYLPPMAKIHQYLTKHGFRIQRTRDDEEYFYILGALN